MDQLIADYQLAPHPEGGYFRETYRSKQTLAGSGRSLSTAIYYLLPAGQRSLLHRIGADEVWHFYRGDPLLVIELQPGAAAKVTRLGRERGELLQYVVPAGTWFGALPAPGSRYSLVGCTVSPGFEFSDFELGKRDALLAQFPEAREHVEALTR
ncbi:MAG: cupin domain-containing protein [Archangium sp.]|nr:cupin domain-containing protein [Archangium sp.]MDP3570555.1 cupin domain-containing protein [Archangium sp.]